MFCSQLGYQLVISWDSLLQGSRAAAGKATILFTGKLTACKLLAKVLPRFKRDSLLKGIRAATGNVGNLSPIG